jgi:ribonuclease P protein component
MKKELKIKKSEEIEAIVKAKQSVSGENFVIYKKENHLPVGPRFALSVPKKFGIAVKRNLMKRRIRSVFDSLNIKKEFDVFVVAKQKSSALSFKQIQEELIMLFERANLVEVVND